jgi:hypothetical protein
VITCEDDVMNTPRRVRAGGWRVVGVAAVLAVAAVACGSPAATSNPAPSATVQPSGAAAVPDLLKFTAPLLGGGTFDGTAFAGKPVAFWFWAPT